MAIICQVCGTENPEGTEFCEGCGVELAADVHDAIADEAIPEPVAAHESMAEGEDESEAEAAPDAAEEVSASSQTAADTDSSAELPEPTAENSEEAASDEGSDEASASDEADPAASPNDAVTTSDGESLQTAQLYVKRYGAVTNDAIPLSAPRLVVGRFDPSTGPVDIDVSGMTGAEHISRRHAEIFFDQGSWHVRDLGSTNGVFIKVAQASSYSPRLQEPSALHDGDEIAFGNVVFVFREES